MDKRIFSLETEYALMTEGRQPDASGNRLYDRLEAALRDVHEAVVCDPIGPRPSGRSAGLVEIKEGLFLDCGARLYYDTGHVEWACPECDNALDATVWDLAADQNWRTQPNWRRNDRPMRRPRKTFSSSRTTSITPAAPPTDATKTTPFGANCRLCR